MMPLQSFLGWLCVALEGLVEKTLDWIIKILINAAGGILKRAANNGLETKSRLARVESPRKGRGRKHE